MTKTPTPKIPRVLWLFCVLLVLCMTGPLAYSQEPTNYTLQPPSASGYSRMSGQPFYLLTDASFGSDQVAQVRLEAPVESGLETYGGADIAIFKVANPIDFLKSQKNLHRIQVRANYTGEGLANTLSFLWSRWSENFNRTWQRIISSPTRSQVTQARPQFKASPGSTAKPRFEQPLQFAALPGSELVTRFRYPIWQVKSATPTAKATEGDVQLAGSTVLGDQRGKVMIPVGKLAPGLYLVQAVIGDHSANTLLFISNTIAAVKSTSNNLLVWTARRDTGKPVADVTINWTDGMGVLQSGNSGADGAVEFAHTAPERSYIIGKDTDGGVFISENFYYDSEIYNTKIYAITDRPLYRPGDTVHVKFIARAFQNAQQSSPAAPAKIKLQVLDPNNAPIAARELDLKSDSGANTDFSLPIQATGGGYTLRFDYQGDTYGAAFRVAEYVKPHFDVNLTMEKPEYATGEALKGKISLRYPDGKPLKNGKVSVTLRAQNMSMVEGELRYAGLFPVKLEQQELKTNDQGEVELKLPAAKEPSRYSLTIFAQDGSSSRVRVTREVLIARGVTSYQLKADKSFSEPGQGAAFTLTASANENSETQQPPTTWEWVRLESQTKSSGTLAAPTQKGQIEFTLKFTQAGSYMVSAKDKSGNLLAATSHWVSGAQLQALPGSVEVQFDHDRYRIGETAEALITFPYAVDDALLTLERDKVQARSLLSAPADWVKLQRIAPTQWKARIPVNETFTPNVIFSVLYIRDGQYAFKNAGIMIERPMIALEVKSDKAVYAPGETVSLDLASTFEGKPLPSHLTVSVVDEMVYLLQPEIAPNIADFFYHPRRNNVRTTMSLSFISYDLAVSSLRGASSGPRRNQYNERGVKVIERPRRDEIDTAAWAADLVTDANGHAVMKLKMPDSLTRWRITVRAVSGNGEVGQRTTYIASDKALYLKWANPRDFRIGDQPTIDIIAFNQGKEPVKAQWSAQGVGFNLNQAVTLQSGANYLRLPSAALETGALETALSIDGKVVDRLSTPIRLSPVSWSQTYSMQVPLNGKSTAISFPQADAYDVQVRILPNSVSNFARVVDDLIDYPYGCTEQTSSRLIPLVLARDTLLASNPSATPESNKILQGLENRLRNERGRLALLAGVDGYFGWWGDGGSGGNAFLTAYAYYADKLASDSLGLNLPAENWANALEAYRKTGSDSTLLQQSLNLWLLQQMGLPVTTVLEGVAQELTPPFEAVSKFGEAENTSLLFTENSDTSIAMARVLTAWTARTTNARLSTAFKSEADKARVQLAASKLPLVQSLLLMTSGTAPSPAQAGDILATSSAQHPTIDRALTLLWMRSALKQEALVSSVPNLVGPQWKMSRSITGAATWYWQGSGLPKTIDLNNLPAGLTASISYRSKAPGSNTAPVKITRALYRLDPVVPQGAEEPDTKLSKFTAQLVSPGQTLDSNALYVDEITLVPTDSAALAFGLIEAPLPPGGSVEATSWGVTISGLGTGGNSDPEPFERVVTYEMGDLGYRQPVPMLSGKPMAVRQLVRFSLPGKFKLPPVRYWRMYQPGSNAYEGASSDHVSTMAIE